MGRDMKLITTLVLSFALFASMTTDAASSKNGSVAPELVIVNASIHTMDQTRPTAEALAISGNRIMAVGSSSEMRAVAGPNTRVIDAGGKLVLPGFNDAHVHYLMGGFSLANV